MVEFHDFHDMRATLTTEKAIDTGLYSSDEMSDTEFRFHSQTLRYKAPIFIFKL